MTVGSRRIVGLLADESRRRVVAALVLVDGSADLAAIVEASGLTTRQAIDALDRLSDIVTQADGHWHLDGDVFATAARAEVEAPAPSAFSDEPAEIAKVLDTAFSDGKLVAFPSKRAKRLIVLDHLAQQFDIGQRYLETEVNDVLRAFDDDVAMLRRWLVDEQFMDRAEGRYWRCGGTV